MDIMSAMKHTLHEGTRPLAARTGSTSRWPAEMRAPIDAALHQSTDAPQQETDGAPAVDSLHLFD